MPGTLKVGGNIIASHTGVEGAGEVALGNVTLGGGQFSGIRNLIINGNFRINQRGAASITATSAAYNYDRWYYGSDGKLYQGIEDQNIVNGTYTISWSDAGSDLTAEYVVSTDTTAGDGPDSGLTWTSVSNKGNITVNEANEFSKHLWIRFSGTLSNLSKVQVEYGTVATPFEHRPIGLELSLCQRYFYRLSAEYTYTNFFQASWRASTDARGVIPFPVTMRAVPSFSTDGSITSLGNGTYSSLQLADSGSKYQGNMQLNGSNGTIGFSTTVRANNDATAGLNFTAEL